MVPIGDARVDCVHLRVWYDQSWGRWDHQRMNYIPDDRGLEEAAVGDCRGREDHLGHQVRSLEAVGVGHGELVPENLEVATVLSALTMPMVLFCEGIVLDVDESECVQRGHTCCRALCLGSSWTDARLRCQWCSS